jgi:hypothetical protein
MTYRERRERRIARLRGWADVRQIRAAAVFDANEVYRGDFAFNTQPGHIPERARVIARTDRAIEGLQKAERLDERADNIESQLASSIYDDDPDAVDRLRERIAGLEAERDRIKAYNTSCRKRTPNESLLNDRERSILASVKRLTPSALGRNGSYPAYHLSNLNGNIARNRQRLRRLTGEA